MSAADKLIEQMGQTQRGLDALGIAMDIPCAPTWAQMFDAVKKAMEAGYRYGLADAKDIEEAAKAERRYQRWLNSANDTALVEDERTP